MVREGEVFQTTVSRKLRHPDSSAESTGRKPVFHTLLFYMGERAPHQTMTVQCCTGVDHQIKVRGSFSLHK